jgi:hypothetical protein
MLVYLLFIILSNFLFFVYSQLFSSILVLMLLLVLFLMFHHVGFSVYLCWFLNNFIFVSLSTV